MTEPVEGPVGNLPITLRESMETYFRENPCLGQGDLRANITLENLQRTETADHWQVCGKRLSRADVMEMALHLVAEGYSIPALLKIPGMPRSRTFMGWVNDYKVFADLMARSEQIRAAILAEQAVEILDATTDSKKAFINKNRADIRMRFAEVLHSKKYGKKQILDVQHHDDLSAPETWSRLTSFLTVHAKLIQENTGIQVIVPNFEEAVVVEPEAEVTEQETLGMQGDLTEPDFTEGIDFGEIEDAEG